MTNVCVYVYISRVEIIVVVVVVAIVQSFSSLFFSLLFLLSMYVSGGVCVYVSRIHLTSSDFWLLCQILCVFSLIAFGSFFYYYYYFYFVFLKFL